MYLFEHGNSTTHIGGGKVHKDINDVKYSKSV